jgi:hypothetical protein
MEYHSLEDLSAWKKVTELAAKIHSLTNIMTKKRRFRINISDWRLIIIYFWEDSLTLA